MCVRPSGAADEFWMPAVPFHRQKRDGRPWAYPMHAPQGGERDDFYRTLPIPQRKEAIEKERKGNLKLPPNGVWRRCGYDSVRFAPF